MVTILIGCSESAGPGISKQGEGVIGKLNNIEVENIPGGAHIYYSLPKKSDFAYVEAIYSTKSNGEQKNKSSRYSDSITLKGFYNAEPHEVKLYACSLDGRRSDPITIEIEPLTPTFKRVFDSLKAKAIFGGVGIGFNNNINQEDLTLYVVRDSLEFIKPVQQKYIKKEVGVINIYNLKSESTKFGFFIKDNFNNYSDTLYSTLKPLYEVELDKSLWSNPKLPTDTWQHYKDYEFEQLWDDAAERYDYSFETGEFYEFPMWFTIDLGQIAKISRAIFYPQPYWESEWPKVFELWGAKEPNRELDADKPFNDSWVKIGTYEPHKPGDGIDPSAPYPSNGFVLPIEDAETLPEMQYIRIKVLSSWNGNTFVDFGEFTFFGQPINKSSE